MKIETLIDDIYAFLNKPDVKAVEEGVPELVKDLTTRITESLSREMKPGLRMSNLGQPDRKLWYTINQPEKAEPLAPNVRVKFLLGDIFEALSLFLAQAAGHKVERRQEMVEIDGVRGRIDGTIDGRLVDCKSSSTYGMDKFRENAVKKDDPFGYIPQFGAYAFAMGLDKGSFLAGDKTLGHLVLDTYELKGVDYKREIANKRAMLAKKEPPPRCYPDEKHQDSGNRKLGVGCSYCDFKRHCWQGLRLFMYSGKPVFLTKVVREPRPDMEIK